jgi:hypothetical protein
MKQELILNVIAEDLGTNDISKLNEMFKSEKFNHIKYRMMGAKLGHFGFTANIKNISKDGIKVFLVNKVKLIRFEEIERFDKAKPRVERPVRKKPIVDEGVKKTVVAVKKTPRVKKESDEKDEASEKNRRKLSRQDNRFIPLKSR